MSICKLFNFVEVVHFKKQTLSSHHWSCCSIALGDEGGGSRRSAHLAMATQNKAAPVVEGRGRDRLQRGRWAPVQEGLFRNSERSERSERRTGRKAGDPTIDFVVNY